MKIFETIVALLVILFGVFGVVVMIFFEIDIMILIAISIMSWICINFGINLLIYNRSLENRMIEKEIKLIKSRRFKQNNIDNEWVDISDEMNDIIKK